MTTYCRWEHPEKQRYYKIVLAQDLFGEWVVTRVWGGIGKATGRITHYPCTSEMDGLKIIEKISKTRLAHGYIACSETSSLS